MKLYDIQRLAKCGLAADTAGCESIISAYLAQLESAGRHMAAKPFRRMLAGRVAMPMTKTLPSDTGAGEFLWWEQPQQSLDSLDLPLKVRDEIDWFLREYAARERLAEFDFIPRRTILLHGPSGNGKTSIARSIASQIGRPLATVRIAQCIDSTLGSTGKNVEAIWSAAARHPCVLFFDEFDSIGGARGSDAREGQASAARELSRVVTGLLLSLDRLSPNAIVIAATNRVDAIDAAIRRRFEVELEIPAPDAKCLEVFARRIGERRTAIPVEIDKSELGTSFASAENWVIEQQRRKVICGK